MTTLPGRDRRAYDREGRRGVARWWDALAPIRTVFFYAMLVFIAACMLVPFLWMISTSLKPPGTAFSYPPQILPTTFDFRNYRSCSRWCRSAATSSTRCS